MPVYTEWANEEHTIIRMHIQDPWEINEYLDASAQTQTLMKSVGYPVHLIIDLTEMNTFPKNLLSSITTINDHILPGQGLVIGVRFSPYLRAVTKVASRLFPRISYNLVYTHTLKEAYALIEAHDQPASYS
jgi:hypothetical protein